MPTGIRSPDQGAERTDRGEDSYEVAGVLHVGAPGADFQRVGKALKILFHRETLEILGAMFLATSFKCPNGDREPVPASFSTVNTTSQLTLMA